MKSGQTGKTSIRPMVAGRANQQGVSLLLALLFMAVFSGVVVTFVRLGANEGRENTARVAGWELVEIGKAARLMVRDDYAAAPNPVTYVTNSGTASLIALQTLRDRGYLPQNFGRQDGAGNEINALGQRIFIIRANWSSAGAAPGLGGNPALPTTVPSAFVFFAPGGKSTAALTLGVVDSARKNGAALTGALFNAAGTNISADCRGTGPAIGLWDTNCLTRAEFNTLAAQVGIANTFDGSSVIIPAWKAIKPDERALMRYPQPENPGFATMLTDLKMGIPMANCATDQVFVTTADAAGHATSTPTGVCDVRDDTAAIDQRFNIDRVGNVVMERMIAQPQTQDFGPAESFEVGSASDDAFRVNGSITLQNDFRVYDTRPLPAGVAARFAVPNGTTVVERNNYLYSENTTSRGHATIGTANALSLVSDTLRSTQFNSLATGTKFGSAPTVNVTQRTTLTNNLTVKGSAANPGELITETINGNPADLETEDDSGQVQITGTLNMRNGPGMLVRGARSDADTSSPYGVVIGEIVQADTVTVTGRSGGSSTNDFQFLGGAGTLAVTGTEGYAGAGQMNQVAAPTQCKEGKRVAGGCPDRQYFPPNITP